MPGVVINEFEAVAEPAPRGDNQGGGEDGAAKKIEPVQLRMPLHRIATRAARLRAH